MFMLFPPSLTTPSKVTLGMELMVTVPAPFPYTDDPANRTVFPAPYTNPFESTLEPAESKLVTVSVLPLLRVNPPSST